MKKEDEKDYDVSDIIENLSEEDQVRIEEWLDYCINEKISLMQKENEKDEIDKIKTRMKEAVKGIMGGYCSRCKRTEELFKDVPHLNKTKCEYHEGFEEGQIQERHRLEKIIDEVVDEVDIELLFTDIKDKQGNKVELSDEIMQIISIWWEQKSEDLKSTLKERIGEKT